MKMLVTDEELHDLRQRNAERVLEAQRQLGVKWVLHESHAAVNKDKKIVHMKRRAK